jgi:3',5'-cyclic AMP phosphodiesterase CpdA
MKLAWLSDLHLDMTSERAANVLARKLRAAEADHVVVTGARYGSPDVAGVFGVP